MKRLGEMLLKPEAFSEIVMGNTALVRAMLESGVRVATSYPGSPTPEIAEAISALPQERRNLYFEFSVNEKIATEVAFGASVNGYLSTVFFKSVGINVAADSFVQLGHMALIGGMVIILGDDPGANSSQNEQDNRHYARLAYIPVFEPATAQEAYEMFKEAAKLSRSRQMPVILRLTTHVCHAKEKVNFAPLNPPKLIDIPRFNPANGPYVPITKDVFPLKRRALQKLTEFRAESERFTQTVDHGNRERGVITVGCPFLSLMDTLGDLPKKPDILKIGVVHPLPHEAIARFLSTHREVKILEELDDFVEQQIKALAYERGIPVKIIGKLSDEDWMGEYTPEKVEEVLRRCWPDLLPPPKKLPEVFVQAPGRPAQMCPGCGHRSAFHAIKIALKKDDITVADIGCHSLGYLEPYRMGQVLLCMGHVLGTSAGLSLFNESRPVVGFIGDSTFFHAGLPGIVNAIYNKHNFTLILMENGTTAMTGHQDHAATGKNFREVVDKIPVMQVLKGLGVTDIQEIDAYQQAKLTEMVKGAVQRPGFKVIIAKHPCMLKFVRQVKRSGKKLPPPVHVTEKCDSKLTCITEFACPSYQISEQGKVYVEKDLCIGDGSCIQTCPSGAIERGKTV